MGKTGRKRKPRRVQTNNLLPQISSQVSLHSSGIESVNLSMIPACHSLLAVLIYLDFLTLKFPEEFCLCCSWLRHKYCRENGPGKNLDR